MEYPSVTITKTENGWILKYTTKVSGMYEVFQFTQENTRVYEEWRYVEDFLKDYLILDKDILKQELMKRADRKIV